MIENSVTKQSQIIVRIMKVNSLCWDTSFLFDVRESTHLFTLYDSYMRKWKTPPPTVGRRERNIYTEIEHRDNITR